MDLNSQYGFNREPKQKKTVIPHSNASILLSLLLLLCTSAACHEVPSENTPQESSTQEVDSTALALTQTSRLSTPVPSVSPPSMNSALPYQFISLDNQGNAILAGKPRLSTEGRYVIFADGAQVYLRDTITGFTVLVTSGYAGKPGNDWSFAPSISGNGNFVVFFSLATNLIESAAPGCTNEPYCGALYLYDSESRTFSRLFDGFGRPGSDEFDTAVSRDGSVVAFAAPAAKDAEGVYLLDRISGTLTQVAAGNPTASGPGTKTGGYRVELSGDGKILAFVSADNGIMSEDQNGAMDVFVYDRSTGRTEWISRPIGNKQTDWPSGLQWVPQTGGAIESGMSISNDGRYITLMSTNPDLVTPSPPPCKHYWGEIFPACRHIYLYDRLEGTVKIVDQVDGVPGNLPAEGGSISDDNHWVVFSSYATNLTADPHASTCLNLVVEGYCNQVYLANLSTGEISCVSKGFDGTTANSGAYDAAISGDGQFITFASMASNLVQENPCKEVECIFGIPRSSIVSTGKQAYLEYFGRYR